MSEADTSQNNTCPMCRAVLDPSVDTPVDYNSDHGDRMLQLFRTVFTDVQQPRRGAEERVEEGRDSFAGMYS
jgi:hypothetical protein